MILHDDGHFELEPHETDVEDSIEPDDYYEAPAGCCFPDICLMPGDHLLSECHTAEMYEASIKD